MNDSTLQKQDEATIGTIASTAMLEAVGSVWTRSLVEEVIGCLWLISAVLAFGFKFDTLGWLLAIKSATDQGAAIFFAIKEAVAEEKASKV